jgi:hypothetical protein
MTTSDLTTVYGRRLPWLLPWAIGAAFFVWPLSTRVFWSIPAPTGLVLWLLPAFGLFAAVVSAIQIVRPDQVTIDAEGLSWRSWRGVRRWAWTDLDRVDRIAVGPMPRIALVYPFRKQNGRGVRRRVALPWGLPLDIERLRALLENAPARAGGRPPPEPEGLDLEGLIAGVAPVGLMVFYLVFFMIQGAESRRVIARMEQRCGVEFAHPSTIGKYEIRYYRAGGCPPWQGQGSPTWRGPRPMSE